MTSFYCSHSPSSFFVEYGWGGLVIDPATWQPHKTHDGPGFCGHERLYMEPERRALAWWVSAGSKLWFGSF